MQVLFGLFKESQLTSTYTNIAHKIFRRIYQNELPNCKCSDSMHILLYQLSILFLFLCIIEKNYR